MGIVIPGREESEHYFECGMRSTFDYDLRGALRSIVQELFALQFHRHIPLPSNIPTRYSSSSLISLSSSINWLWAS